MNQLVLLVEDRDSIREAIQLSLETQGYVVISAASRQGGIDQFDKAFASITVVITDLDLGESEADGGVIIDHIRKKNPMVPVILMTGLDLEDDGVAVISKTADVTLSKPFGTKNFAMLFSEAAARRLNTLESERLAEKIPA